VGTSRISTEAATRPALLRALKRNAAVWYAPDQMHSHGELLPFFGEPAMTSLSTSKLARLSGAPVVPFSFRRSDERGHHELEFHEPLRDAQTADARTSTQWLVSRLEDFIREAPEQYQWLHRRSFLRQVAVARSLHCE
jgi:Kdo2-lipid IVA lauroyltransferase/acyltransferase